MKSILMSILLITVYLNSGEIFTSYEQSEVVGGNAAIFEHNTSVYEPRANTAISPIKVTVPFHNIKFINED